jgi:DNA-binding IclR family transcriptional regulator
MKWKKDKVVLSRISQLKLFADETGHSVSWSVLRGGERVILFVTAPARRGTLLKKRIKHEPPYRHAAGWMLMAGLSPRMMRAYYKKWGVPGDYWPEMCDEADFLQVLRTVQKNGGLVKSVDDRTEIAAPILREDRIIAAISLSLSMEKTSAEKSQELLSRLQETAREISQEDHYRQPLRSCLWRM